jgi:ketosteroid isomerase-like protein
MATPDASEAVAAAEDQLFEAMATGNTAAAAELLSDELVYIHSGNAMRDDKAAYLARVGSGFYGALTISHPRESVSVIGDVAVVLGQVVAAGESQGITVERAVQALDVWRRRDGRWQLFAHAGTSLPPREP